MAASVAVIRSQVESSLSSRWGAVLTWRPKPQIDHLPTGIAAVDALCGGIPRGCLTEICGAASSGRTTLLFSFLSHATRNQEVCALVDASDAFHPASAQAAGVDLTKLLWVRCNAQAASRRQSPHMIVLEQALKATDLLLQSGGFGAIVVDLAGLPAGAARRVPLASWFRFRRAVEETPTALLALEQQANARTCASLVMDVSRHTEQWSGSSAAHGQLLRSAGLHVEVTRDRVTGAKKPAQNVRVDFQANAICY
jgi:recombination protein RecA